MSEAQNQDQVPQFALQRIYVKDISFGRHQHQQYATL